MGRYGGILGSRDALHRRVRTSARMSGCSSWSRSVSRSRRCRVRAWRISCTVAGNITPACWSARLDRSAGSRGAGFLEQCGGHTGVDVGQIDENLDQAGSVQNPVHVVDGLFFVVGDQQTGQRAAGLANALLLHRIRQGRRRKIQRDSHSRGHAGSTRSARRSRRRRRPRLRPARTDPGGTHDLPATAHGVRRARGQPRSAAGAAIWSPAG